MARLRRRVCACSLLVIAACSGAHPSPSETAAANRYDSRQFVLPLTVTVDATLQPEPAHHESNLLYWNARNVDDKVRFLVPIEVYRPHHTVPESPPKDFLNYVRGQAADGAKFSDIVTLTVDGHPATVMTTTSTTGLEGSIGCPSMGAHQSEECFGFQPVYVIRIAIMDVDGTLFLAWARTPAAMPDAAFLSAFDKMLVSIKFGR